MKDTFVIKLEAGGVKYVCSVTSESGGKNTFFVVSYKTNDGNPATRSFEIEVPDEDNENEIPLWTVRNKNKYSEEIFSDEFIQLIGQKISYYYDLMLYGSYSRQ